MNTLDNFADRLLRAIDEKENLGIVGLDPDIDFIPPHIKNKFLQLYGDTLEAVGAAIIDFNKQIIDAVFDIVPAVKPQIAYYELYQQPGITAFIETIKYAKQKGLLVIEDGKRNDIGPTAKKYSQGHLGRVKLLSGREIPSYDLDALTINGYLGSDCVLQFVEDCKKYGKGIFVLDKTSNPSAGELQDEILESKIRVSEKMAHMINKLGEGTEGKMGYRSIGAVVGATYAADAMNLRKIMTSNIFLVPGYETQGGRPEDIPNFINNDGRGAIVNSSRGIIAAYLEPQYKEKYGYENFYKASREKAIKMKRDITEALRRSGKSRW